MDDPRDAKPHLDHEDFFANFADRLREDASQHIQSFVLYAQQMIQELVDAAPKIDKTLFTPGGRKTIAQWRDRCITTVRKLLKDDEAWAPIYERLHFAEFMEKCPADELRPAVEYAVIHLRTLHVACRISSLRTDLVVTPSEYLNLFPDAGLTIHMGGRELNKRNPKYPDE